MNDVRVFGSALAPEAITQQAASVLRLSGRSDGEKRVNGRRLSIAICVYNGVSYVREQLDSIAAQDRLPDELVVCDDRTPQTAEAFASRAAFSVRLVVNEKNLGYPKNTEKAIRLSTGDAIFLSDQDDVWHREKLGHPQIGAVFSNAEIADERLYPLGYSLWQLADFNRNRQKRFARGRALEVLLGGNVAYGATMAFCAKFKDLILPIPSVWDADEWIALLVSTVTAVIHEPLVKYRLRLLL